MSIPSFDTLFDISAILSDSGYQALATVVQLLANICLEVQIFVVLNLLVPILCADHILCEPNLTTPIDLI